jgi:hypothetical protein
MVKKTGELRGYMSTTYLRVKIEGRFLSVQSIEKSQYLIGPVMTLNRTIRCVS